MHHPHHKHTSISNMISTKIIIARNKTITLIVILLLFLLVCKSESLQDGTNHQPQEQASYPFIHRLLNWVKTNTFYAHLFPPNLDFRGRIGSDGPPVVSSGIESDKGEESGPGEKVKEAVVMTLDEGKAVVESSAKSAADLAKEKMHQTAQILKDTFSSHHRQQDDETTEEL